MFDTTCHAEETTTITVDTCTAAIPLRPAAGGLEALLQGLPLRRRKVRAKEHLFRAGQPRHALYFVNAGFFKTSVVSEDGREKVTGFRMRGDLLGIDALDLPVHACDAVALDVGEVWELPVAQLSERIPDFQARLTAALASEIRRDWGWMLAVGTLSAEQRVVAFVLDLATRLQAMGYSARNLLLRMTRAELGNFLALQLETVTRALSHLQARGLIDVEGRQIRIQDPAGLRAMLGSAPQALAA